MLTPNFLISTPANKESQTNFKFSEDLNDEFLNKNYSNNLDLAVSIFTHFTENIEAEINTLKQNIEDYNYQKIIEITHKIKNNFTYVGASNLTTLIKQIETEAKEENNSISNTFNQFLLASHETLNSISKQLELIKEYLEK